MAVKSQVIRRFSGELYVLRSDAAYAALMKASVEVAASNFSQVVKLELWRCFFHFAVTRWIYQARK